MQAVQDKMVLAITASLAQKQIEGEAASPLIDIIIQLIPVLLPLIVGCFSTPKSRLEVAQNPGWLARLRLRREIRNLEPGNDKDSERARNLIFDETLKAAKLLTEADMAAMSA